MKQKLLIVFIKSLFFYKKCIKTFFGSTFSKGGKKVGC